MTELCKGKNNINYIHHFGAQIHLNYYIRVSYQVSKKQDKAMSTQSRKIHQYEKIPIMESSSSEAQKSGSRPETFRQMTFQTEHLLLKLDRQLTTQ